MRAWILFPAALLIFGCSGPVNKNLVPGETLSSAQEPLMLSSSRLLSGVHNFLEKHKQITEQDKINYLLERMRDSSVTFIRNGNRYNGLTAMQWLRWKMRHPQYREYPIDTAIKFVEIVCDRSTKTGVPYEVIIEGGRHGRLREAMENELNYLEMAIRQRMLENAVSTEIHSVQEKSEDLVASAVLPSAG